MSALNLHPVSPSSPSSFTAHHPTPLPSASPHNWQFQYSPSVDGKETNLLILFHGLGDTEESFFSLGKSLKLPETCVLSLRGPEGVPLMDSPSYSWYQTFSSQFPFAPLSSPNPQPTLTKLLPLVLGYLCGPDIQWRSEQIHLFGWGQGGSMALELARELGVIAKAEGKGHSGGPDPNQQIRRFGSAISVCGPLLRTPSVGVPSLNAATPVLYFHRSTTDTVQLDPSPPTSLTRTFLSVEVLRGPRDPRKVNPENGTDESMIAGEKEWREIMRFWSRVLGKAGDQSWMKGGDVYEVRPGGGGPPPQQHQQPHQSTSASSATPTLSSNPTSDATPPPPPPPPPPPSTHSATRLTTDFPSLSSFSEQDLKDLLSDDVLLSAFLYTSVPQITSILDEQERLSQTNEILAKKNLSFQDPLIALRTSTASAHAAAQNLKARFEEVEGKQKAIYQKFRPSFLHTRLRHSVQDLDGQTEKFAQEWIEAGRGESPTTTRIGTPLSGFEESQLDGRASPAAAGSMSLEEFVRTFKAQRKTYHKRAIWCERWTRGEVEWRDD